MLSGQHEREPKSNPDSTLRCPRCGSEIIHQSRRRTIRDRVRGIFNYRPYRCEDCDLRFHYREKPG